MNDHFELSAATEAVAEWTTLGVPIGAEADLMQLRGRVGGYNDDAHTIRARIVAPIERTSPS